MVSLKSTFKQPFHFGTYLFCSWLFSVFLCTGYFQTTPLTQAQDYVHSMLAIATYALLYLLPAILTYAGLKRWKALSIIMTVLVSSFCHVLIFADVHLFDLYGFHFNGFVWNLLTTPGGYDSLGADQTNVMLVIRYVSVLIFVHLISLLLAFQQPVVSLSWKTIMIVFVISTISERVLYGVSDAELYGPTLSRGDALWLYQPLTMRSLLEKLGIEVKQANKIILANQSDASIDYPKKPLALQKVAHPMNIIMLVAESMRWDLLTPKTMPNLHAFSQESWNFTHHYSGGNGTRQGMFALFYGLPGVYWDSFLREQRSPVLFNVLDQYHYQYFVYTGAKFTYPEFDQTIFKSLPKEQLIENDQGEPWKRDQANTTALIHKIEERDSSKPFFGFVFYESTHARYSFSKAQAINPDYIREFNYAGLSRKKLTPHIKGFKARYENAAHGIDQQLSRIIEALKQSGDMDNTMIVITGDHGEEFMERGRWGHNSAFTDWQVRVPMVVHLPNETPKNISKFTSHQDLPITLLSRLGVSNNPHDYSTGLNLSTPKQNRNIIVSSWNDIGLINHHGKLVIPFKARTQHQNLALDLNDYPTDQLTLFTEMKSDVTTALAQCKLYRH